MPDNSERLRVTVIGLSYSPLQNGAYAMLLSVEGKANAGIRIPVVIGEPEAQSIAIHLEKVDTRRPMTHQLFASFAQAFGIRLIDVCISSFKDGIFSSEMTFTDGEQQIVIDARTSDAIAIALRCRAPIYTTQEIVDLAGIRFATEESELSETSESSENSEISEPSEPSEPQENLADLEARLAQLIENEDYEEAAVLSARIKDLKSKK